MSKFKEIQEYLNANNIDIAFLIALLGMFISPFISYAWVIAIIACFFIKEDNDDELQVN